MFQVIATTQTGERVVVGFGFKTRQHADNCADKFRVEKPRNVFTDQPYTYTVKGGGTPDNVVMINGRPMFRR